MTTPPPAARPGAEDTYKKVFDCAADAIFIHDRESHRFLDCNRSALERYGYSLEEIQQMTPYDLHPHAELDKVRENIDVRNRDEPYFYTHVTKHGTEFPVEILTEEVEYHGTPAWLSIARDISERRRAEEALAATRDQALAASKAKSDFVAGVSHELRTPMNGIMGMVALLLETHLSGEQREYAETINSAADSMLQLLNEILDLSKIEAGKLEIEPIPFDLHDSIASVSRLLTPKARNAGLDLVFHCAPDVPHHVIGDPTRLRQVVTNLAGNAIKFTKEGHVAIRVEGRRQDEARASIRISVEDTGIGIAEDRLEAIFEEFTQADLSTTRNYGGTGLGLTISRQLVSLMGGELRVESRPDQGSTFWFDLDFPLQRRLEADDADRLVLVVHPDGSARHTLAEHLRELDMATLPAASSAEALDLLAERGRAIHAALVHYVLPDLDGETLGRALRSRDPDLEMHLLLPEGLRLPEARIRNAGFTSAVEGTPDAAQLRDRFSSPAQPVDPASEPVPPIEERRVRVLVVEDNPVNQKVVQHILGKLDCDVDLADDGVRAVDKVQGNPRYDIILMDCQMPEMDGYEATRRIRELEEEKAQTPIVALTANAMDGDRQRCLDAGMDDYMSKPATSAQISEMIGKWTMESAEA